MQNDSRLKKCLLNARVNLIFYVLILCLSFFSRKIFLDCLGADFMGLTGSVGSLLGFLNLAELGVASAVGYVLYKPLFEKDQPKINEIISVFGYLYRKIGHIITGSGLVLACFLPLIFPNTGFSWGVIYLAYGTFLASSVIGYYVNYRAMLLGADQRNYVVAMYSQSAGVIKVALQMWLAWYTHSYYLWIITEFAFGLLYAVVLNWRIRQVYPWLKAEVALGKQVFKKYPQVIKYTKQIFVHKIAGFVQFQSTPFLVYLFVSLEMTAFYANYTVVVDRVNALLGNLLSSSDASVGNLIAEGNQGKIRRIFNELFTLRMWMAAATVFPLYELIDPFVTIWLGTEFLLPRIIVVLVAIRMFISTQRGATDQFLYGYGLFWDMWAPVTEAVLNIVVALVCGYYWGLPGVLMGGIVSLVAIVGIWKPFMLYTWGFRVKVRYYWLQFFYQFAVLAALALLGDWLWRHSGLQPARSVWDWFVSAAILTSLFGLASGVALYIGTQGMRDFVHRAWGVLQRRLAHWRGKK